MEPGSRAEMEARVPARYLAEGWLDEAGGVRPGLVGADATAAAMQLMAAEVAPQELGFTVAALQLLIPQHEQADAGRRLSGALAEALATVARAIQQPNNAGLCAWLWDCAGRVARGGDLVAFQAHLVAVDRQYGLLVALQPA